MFKFILQSTMVMLAMNMYVLTTVALKGDYLIRVPLQVAIICMTVITVTKIKEDK